MSETMSILYWMQIPWQGIVHLVACLWGNVEIPIQFCKKCTGHESVPKPKLELLEVAILILYSIMADFFISVHYLLRKMQKYLYDFARNAIQSQRIGTVQVTRASQSKSFGFTMSLWTLPPAPWPIFASQFIICCERCKMPLRFCKKCHPEPTNRQCTGHESTPMPSLVLLEVAMDTT